jgi:hypothetical protein
MMTRTAIPFVILAIMGSYGCSEDCDQRQDSDGSICDCWDHVYENGETRADTGSQTTEPDSGETNFEAFELPIDQHVTVGAFVLDLDSVLVSPGTGGYGQSAHVELSFQAHNASEDVAMPLVLLEGDGLVFEAAGKFYFGDVVTQEVPGLRDGAGTVSWEIWDDLSEDDLRNGVITFGGAAHNQAVVPLSDLSAVINHADQELETQFIVKGYRSTTLDLPIARVQYNSRGNNLPLPAGTAILVLQGSISADPDMHLYGEVWSEQNAFLERPDGISVAPNYLNEAIYPGDREDLTLVFDLVTPVAGTYTFGIVDRDLPDETQEFVIP